MQWRWLSQLTQSFRSRQLLRERQVQRRRRKTGFLFESLEERDMPSTIPVTVSFGNGPGSFTAAAQEAQQGDTIDVETTGFYSQALVVHAGVNLNLHFHAIGGADITFAGTSAQPDTVTGGTILANLTNAGYLTLNKSTVIGNFTNPSTGNLTVVGGTVIGPFVNQGTAALSQLAVVGTTLNAGTLTEDLTVNMGDVVNTGTLTTTLVTTIGDLTNAGTAVSNSSGFIGFLQNTGFGKLTMNNSSILGGGIVNSATASLNQCVFLNTPLAVSNSGTFNLTGGTLMNGKVALVNSGTASVVNVHISTALEVINNTGNLTVTNSNLSSTSGDTMTGFTTGAVSITNTTFNGPVNIGLLKGGSLTVAGSTFKAASGKGEALTVAGPNVNDGTPSGAFGQANTSVTSSQVNGDLTMTGAQNVTLINVGITGALNINIAGNLTIDNGAVPGGSGGISGGTGTGSGSVGIITSGGGSISLGAGTSGSIGNQVVQGGVVNDGPASAFSKSKKRTWGLAA